MGGGVSGTRAALAFACNGFDGERILIAELE
jgi:hypothetical protein